MIYENPMLPKVVTLCGSTRFKNEFMAKTEELKEILSNKEYWEERYKNYWFSTKPEAEARLKELQKED